MSRDPGFYDDIPESTYHADRDSLSVSGAKTLLKAPALFRWEQDNPPYKNVWEFGSAAHALVLGRGMEQIYVAPFDNWQTKAAQAERKIARDERLSPVLPSEWEVVCAMADRLAGHSLAIRLLSEGKPEVSAYALDDETGVMRRGRFDWLGASIAVDYKSARSADPAEFGAAAARLGYDMQHAYYFDIARDLGMDLAAFCFIVQMKEPPYLVSVIELDGPSVERGRARCRRALEMFRDCREADVWPGFLPDTEFATVSVPRWALADEDAS